MQRCAEDVVGEKEKKGRRCVGDGEIHTHIDVSLFTPTQKDSEGGMGRRRLGCGWFASAV